MLKRVGTKLVEHAWISDYKPVPLFVPSPVLLPVPLPVHLPVHLPVTLPYEYLLAVHYNYSCSWTYYLNESFCSDWLICNFQCQSGKSYSGGYFVCSTAIYLFFAETRKRSCVLCMTSCPLSGNNTVAYLAMALKKY